MHSNTDEHLHLVKFLLVSAVSFFIGAIHGMLQVLPPIRAWLDSIGSPYGGPGHMIDPLAHAHMNLVGGVVILAMGTTYYLLPIFSGRAIYSLRLIDHSLWWTAAGQFCFYITLIVFGALEGNALLNNPQDLPQIHHYYGPIIAGSGIMMASGFCIYLVNIILSLIKSPKGS
jgi:heme/copper-type cytochrome/quinol oxidase subunit 1